MKKMNAQGVFMPATERGIRKSMLSIFSVLIFIFAFSVNTSQAQSIQLVDEAAATVILKAEVNSLEIQLAGLPQGSPSYEEVSNRVNYYSHVASFIATGLTVEQSVFDGFSAALGSNPNLSNLTAADEFYGNLTGQGGGQGHVINAQGVVLGTNNNPYIDGALVLLKK